MTDEKKKITEINLEKINRFNQCRAFKSKKGNGFFIKCKSIGDEDAKVE